MDYCIFVLLQLLPLLPAVVKGSLFQQVAPYQGGVRKPSPLPGTSFDPDLLSVVNVPLDSIAYLHCRIRYQAHHQVVWVRQHDGHVLYIGEEAFTNDHRFSMSYRQETNDWCLVIRSCGHNDTGQYECQLSTEPLQRFVVTLNVIENDAQIRGTPAVIGGEDISVQCEVVARNDNNQLPHNVKWTLNDTLLDIENETRYRVVRHRRDNKLVHTLVVLQASTRDTGKYTCLADNTPSKSMLVQVRGSANEFAVSKVFYCLGLSIYLMFYANSNQFWTN